LFDPAGKEAAKRFKPPNHQAAWKCRLWAGHSGHCGDQRIPIGGKLETITRDKTSL
jgi:hypothetical protein